LPWIGIGQWNGGGAGPVQGHAKALDDGLGSFLPRRSLQGSAAMRTSSSSSWTSQRVVYSSPTLSFLAVAAFVVLLFFMSVKELATDMADEICYTYTYIPIYIAIELARDKLGRGAHCINIETSTSNLPSGQMALSNRIDKGRCAGCAASTQKADEEFTFFFV